MASLHSRRYRNPLILRPLPRRKPSRTAAWALRLAAFAPILAIVSLLTYRAGYVDTRVLFTLAGIVLIIALTGVILIAVALQSLWSRGTRGGRQAIGAIFLSIPTLAPFAAAGILWLAMPRQADVSTDLVDPPLFAEELDESRVSRSALVAARLKDGYPTLSGRRYRAAPDAIESTILDVADTFGWQLQSRRGRVGANDELFFEFVSSVPVLTLPGNFVLRVTDEGDTSYVDLRGRLPQVRHDLGWNAYVAERYLQTLDYELVGVAEVDTL
jgi:hypothetical protein